MQILSVTLKNFKAHRDRHFEFQPGTNAICGENGAGKTSLLEAIAWTLFNYQGDYAKEDLIRNGSNSAQVIVALISSRDGRTYEVQRCTQRGYTLYDPQLNQRLPYTRIKDEVMPWLREHLGVGAGTDLPQLFARTLGVPQGTFTADFLQTAVHRKAVFDAILKVEEYQAVYRQMNGLRRFAEAQVETLKQEIAHYDEILAAWDSLNQRHQELTDAIAQGEATLARLEADLQTLQAQRDSLKQQAQQLQALATQRQQYTLQREAKQAAYQRLATALTQADQAVALCAANQVAYEQYLAGEAALLTLSEQQRQRQTLQGQLQRWEKSLGQKRSDLARLDLQIAAFETTAAELARLQPLIDQQTQLENQQKALQHQQTEFQQMRLQHRQTQHELRQTEQQVVQTIAKLARLQEMAPLVDEISALEAQRDRIQQQLSHLAAARQFEAELQQLITHSHGQYSQLAEQSDTALKTLATLRDSLPLLTSDPFESLQRALEAGVTLNQTLIQQLQTILLDLSEQTDLKSLQSKLQTLRKTLDQRYQYRGEMAQIAALQQQQQTLEQQQQQLQAQLQTLTQQLTAEADLAAQQAQVLSALTEMGNPREQSRILDRSLAQKPTVLAQHQALRAEMQSAEQAMADLTEQLAPLADLDDRIAQQHALKQTHQAGYTRYLQHQQLAAQQQTLQAEAAEAQQALEQIESHLKATEVAHAEAEAAFNAQDLAQIEQTYSELRSQADRLSGQIPQQRQTLLDLQQQLAGLEKTHQKRQAADAQRLQKERVRRFINFARKAYKEAGPRITERYVQSVSQEADRLFRELLNRPNVALTWTRDYEIIVQEGANQRRFINLSGGEQMCAALAVRLALLKVLAELDVAFFDEPTTNMDRPRRESLAEAISRIKSFRQLFVISHDDTFEKVTENVIFVERDA